MNSASFQMELAFKNVNTYLFAAAFVVANVLLPQAFHAVPFGGKIFLPLFFFTLIASARFGWKAGLLTAVFSPILSSILFGMPSMLLLPSLLVKGVLLCAAVALVFKSTQKFSWGLLFIAILGYQLIGMLADVIFFTNLNLAWSTLAMSWPGMLMQFIVGGIILSNWKQAPQE